MELFETREKIEELVEMHHKEICNMQKTLSWLVAAILFNALVLIAVLMLIPRVANAAEDISIYDSPSDKSKVVVEYCYDNKCDRLITDRKNLTTKEGYYAIEKWFLDRVDKKEYNTKKEE